MAIIVTRPSPDGERTVAALIAAGINAVHAPLLSIQFARRALPNLRDIDAIAFTSANGVRAWKTNGGPVDLPAFAVGPTARDEALSAGFDVTVTGTADGVALAQAIAGQALKPKKILHVCGTHIASPFRQTLTDAHIAVTPWPLYEAVAAKTPPLPLENLMSDPKGGDLAFFSPRTVKVFRTLFEQDSAASWAQIHAYCLSDAIAKVASTLPFQTVRASSAPTMASFVDMLLTHRT